METIKNDRLLKALRRQPTDCTPVWLMRQAGRYLPEYRKIREREGSFLKMCQTPEIACEITMQPIERFDLDAAIIYSDILTIPDAMGLGLHFKSGEGPAFERPVRDEAAVNDLIIPDPDDKLRYVSDAIRLVKKELDNKIPLIGFAGSPWTVATYMVEGASSKGFMKMRQMMYQAPQVLHVLLEKVTQATILYLNAQIEAGANVIKIFDTWASLLSPEKYLEFSLHYMTKIYNGLNLEKTGSKIPVVFFSKNSGMCLKEQIQSGVDAVGLDWTADFKKARDTYGQEVAFEGNLDPAVLYADPDVIHMEVTKVIKAAGSQPGHVFNLGHGLNPDMSSEHVDALISAVHEISAN